MAIENVTFSIGDNTSNLENTENSVYSGQSKAPNTNGTYTATVSAYDDSGNVSVLSQNLYVSDSSWITPKTNWMPTDRFNYVDYNRIKNNISYIHKLAVSLWKDFKIANMGEDVTEYTVFWDVDVFNFFESNIEEINKNIIKQDFGISQRFYENAPFIKYDELNRIESAILSMYELLERHRLSLRKIPFRLGMFKEVRI